jgi:hypothetical protein
MNVRAIPGPKGGTWGTRWATCPYAVYNSRMYDWSLIMKVLEAFFI